MEDPHRLDRFVDAQATVFSQALAELRSGHKQSHWMWFVFPQLEGLGMSETAKRYGIRSLDEARAYLGHAVLGARLIECAEAVLQVTGKSAHDIFDSPDDRKLCSSATLFAQVSDEGSVFHRLIDRYFDGRADERTLALLAQERRGS